MHSNPVRALGGLVLVTAVALSTFACKGSNGSAGAPGKTGGQAINVPALTTAEWSALSLQATVTSATVATSGTSTPVVKFTVTNDKGVPVIGLGQMVPMG